MWCWEVKLGGRRWAAGGVAWKGTSLLPPSGSCYFLPAVPWALSPLSSPSAMPPCLEPVNYDWNLYKVWTKINLSVLKLWCWVLCPNNEKVTKTHGLPSPISTCYPPTHSPESIMVSIPFLFQASCYLSQRLHFLVFLVRMVSSHIYKTWLFNSF